MGSSNGAGVEWRSYFMLPVAAALGYSTSVIHIYGLGPYLEPLQTALGWSRSQTTVGLTIATFVSAREGLRSSIFHRLFLASMLFTFTIIALVVHFLDRHRIWAARSGSRARPHRQLRAIFAADHRVHGSSQPGARQPARTGLCRRTQRSTGDGPTAQRCLVPWPGVCLAAAHAAAVEA